MKTDREIFDTLDRILKANSPDSQLTEQDQLELFGKIFSYALELTAEKRRNPVDDIWSTLTSAVITDENGEELSLPANELEIFFFVIAFAGSDTTKNALASGLQAFVANPGEIERYRADEAIRASAVEEVLRWSTPVAFWTRSTKVDVEMDGVTIPKGDRVVSMLRSANRDEEVFDDPFTFDIGRAENPHVTFGGGGPHHCLGAMLARAEIRAVLDELLCRADDISLGLPKVAYPNLTNNMSIFDEMAISLRLGEMSPPLRLRVSHRPFGRVPITPSAASRCRSASVSPHSSVSTSALCCPNVGGGRCSHRVGAVERGERRSRVQALSGSRMFEAFEEAAMAQLRVFGHQRWGDDGGRRNPCARKRVDDSIEVLRGEPLAELGAARQRPTMRSAARRCARLIAIQLSSPAHR